MSVIVLGMHRSGTSALTRVVSLLGLHVGEDESLVEATDDNPAGHWEIEALSLFNEDLLLELGGRWSAPPDATTDDVAAMAQGELGTRGAALLDQAFSGRPFVWKDPRLCLLLPFWREVLDEEPVVVWSVRNPLEIAQSLAGRDEMLPSYSLALWERYARRSLLDAGDLPGYLVDYARLLDAPGQVWTDLDKFLDAHDVERGAVASADEVERFVDTSLHRQRRTDAEFRADASSEQAALWELLGSASGPFSGLAPSDLPPETPGIQLAFDEHVRMTRFEALSIQQRAGIDELLEQIADQLASIEVLQGWLDESRAETAHTWSEIRRLERAERELAESKAMILDYLENVIAERDLLRRRFDRIKRLPPVRLVLSLRRSRG
jgi:hypothetical protein